MTTFAVIEMKPIENLDPPIPTTFLVCRGSKIICEVFSKEKAEEICNFMEKLDNAEKERISNKLIEIMGLAIKEIEDYIEEEKKRWRKKHKEDPPSPGMS